MSKRIFYVLNHQLILCVAQKLFMYENNVHRQSIKYQQLSVFSITACNQESFHKHKYQIALDTGI